VRPAGVSFLARCGAWNLVDAGRICPIHLIKVSGDDGHSLLTFDAYRAGLPELAVIVEEANLQKAIRSALASLPLVTVLAGRAVTAAQWTDRAVTLTLDDGSELDAQLAVAADGADSPLRTLAGIEGVQKPYGQRGIVANFRAGRPHRNTAFQWFLDDGVLALLPLPGAHVSLVWSTSEGHTEQLMALSADNLAQQVGKVAAGELGELEPVSPVQSFPLRMMAARRIVAPRLVIVGDAAHTVHPLAGQGLNLGLADCASLTKIIAQRAPNESVASARLLARYRRSRAEEVLAMKIATDGLQRLFAARTPGVRWLRNTGLRLVQKMHPVKHELIKRAAGRPM
jgi:ubiquinone biosynthesis UbiH/UbiF/VisC/COQ6 family hydroxylase